MRPEIVAAERAREVRDAARAWRRTGFIGEEALGLVLERYPDDRVRFGPGFRVLAFIFTLIASCALIGLWFVFFDSNPQTGASLIVWAVVFSGLTELQRGPMRRVGAGAESATALAAAALATLGGTIGFGGGSFNDFLLRFLASGFVACSAAAWRWGDAIFQLGAGLLGFALLAQAGPARLLWIGAAALAIPICLAGARLARNAPSQRRGFMILGAISVLALYGAIHIWSLDQHLVESLSVVAREGSGSDGSKGLRALSFATTALLPPALLLIGWRRREPLLLYAGILLVGASVATIRLYREVMPLSLALCLIGAACLTTGLGLLRWLRSGPARERHGFTADPLLDDARRTEAVRSVVAMASFTPAAQAQAARPAFEGGGGGFGGGGATGSYQ
ncbi:MAG: hypothetical protein K1Y01_18970 [Vicinamibacteria bacterium]|nr:hypothetical protein [Vicinamibacteria bacterium]